MSLGNSVFAPAAALLALASVAVAKNDPVNVESGGMIQKDRAGEVVGVLAAKAPGVFSEEAYFSEMKSKYDSLSQDWAAVRPENFVSVTVTDADWGANGGAECSTCGTSRKLLVGVNKPAGQALDLATAANAGVGTEFAKGWLNANADGDLLWTGVYTSPNAAALRLHFTGFDLPVGAELYLYNASGEVFGPYADRGANGDGDFWTNTITGEKAFVEVRVPKGSLEGSLAGRGFVVSEIAHMGPQLLTAFLPEMAAMGASEDGKALCSYNASCVQDASCYSTSTWGQIDNVRLAVAHMLFRSGAYQYICSGGLVNDTVSTSWIPYFLTANHCISKSAEATSLECYWRYRTTSCGGACTNPYGVVPRTLGSTIKKTNKTSDYTLLQLSQNPPAGSVFLGWTATAVANTSGTVLYRISHPKGAPQAFSRHTVNTTAGTCTSWPRGNWIYSKDSIGATEGGSSGSPVMNASAQIVGQLSGGCGTQTSNVCNTTANSTVDGAFAAYFTAVKPWLNP